MQDYLSGVTDRKFCFSCSSAEEDEDPDTKAQREKERRQANNARER